MSAEEQKRITREYMLVAVRDGNWDRFRLCLEKGADINDRDAYGRTPLMLAVIQGLEGWIEPILKRGGDLFAKDVEGQTVFNYAKKLCVNDLSTCNRVTDILLRALPDKDKMPAGENDLAPDEKQKKITVLKPLVFQGKNKDGKKNPPGGFRF